MRKVKSCNIVLLLSVFLVACSTRTDTSSIVEKITQEETTTIKETTNINETTDGSCSEKESLEEEYVTESEDVLASQAYSVGSGITHIEKKGKEFIKYSVESGDIAFNAGMMMFVNGIPQSFTDEDGNSTYISNVELGANKSKTQYYTCDFNNVEEGQSYVCIKKNMLMPDIMVVKRKGFNMGHLQSLSNGWAHEVECNTFTDVDLGMVEFDIAKGSAYDSTHFEEYIGEEQLYGTVVERSKAKSVTLVYGSPISGEVVIAFWGNNVPVQVGDHMYYKFKAERGKLYSYTFELDEELVGNIDNFFVTATRLCDDITDDDVYKTSTSIFVDKYE